MAAEIGQTTCDGIEIDDVMAEREDPRWRWFTMNVDWKTPSTEPFEVFGGQPVLYVRDLSETFQELSGFSVLPTSTRVSLGPLNFWPTDPNYDDPDDRLHGELVQGWLTECAVSLHRTLGAYLTFTSFSDYIRPGIIGVFDLSAISADPQFEALLGDAHRVVYREDVIEVWDRKELGALADGDVELGTLVTHYLTRVNQATMAAPEDQVWPLP